MLLAMDDLLLRAEKAVDLLPVEGKALVLQSMSPLDLRNQLKRHPALLTSKTSRLSDLLKALVEDSSQVAPRKKLSLSQDLRHL
jgi:hypothetical protein